jgi:hypothetical protein
MSLRVHGCHERLPGWWAPPYIFIMTCDACGASVEAPDLATLLTQGGWAESFHNRGNGGVTHFCPICAARPQQWPLLAVVDDSNDSQGGQV